MQSGQEKGPQLGVPLLSSNGHLMKPRKLAIFQSPYLQKYSQERTKINFTIFRMSKHKILKNGGEYLFSWRATWVQRVSITGHFSRLVPINNNDDDLFNTKCHRTLHSLMPYLICSTGTKGTG